MTDHSDQLRIICLGDTMPGGVLNYELHRDFCSTELLDYLKLGDIRVVTLETAIGDVPNFDSEKMKRDKDVIYCPSQNIYRLAELGIDVVSLANNHFWDLGIAGFDQAKAQLDKLGIKYCGAGRNLKEASEPAIVVKKGKRIGFIAYCDNKPGTCGYVPEATENSPGINVMNEANIRADIEKIKGTVDYLFVMMHWGKEYYYYPTPEVNSLARKIIDWGASGVIGSHSHQIQPTILYKGRPIIFSLGNFFFPDRIITAPRSTFYPKSSEDIAHYPTTDGYPFVDTPTFKKWKPVARRGQAVTISINGQHYHTNKIFTAMDERSHIRMTSDAPPKLFNFSHYLVNLPLYQHLFFAMRASRFIRKKIKGEL